MNLILFFGSGVSRDAGLPNVEKLTKDILSGDYHLHTDRNFYPGHHPNPAYRDGDPTRRIQDFLNVLERHQTEFLRRRTGKDVRANYEHIHHLLDQLYWTGEGVEENGAVEPFMREMESMVPTLFGESQIPGIYDLPSAASKAKGFIECVVWHSLSWSGQKVEGFDLLKTLITSDTIDRLFIITLNHDLLVEMVLDEIEVRYDIDRYDDGFSPHRDENVRWYDPDRFWKVHREGHDPKEGGTKVTLIKPHGSLNWYNIRHGEKYDLGIPHLGHLDKLQGRITGAPRPQFLSGGTKELLYNSGVYSDMHEFVLYALRNTQTVLMSGYGWNDRGMSYRLRTWLERNPNRKIVLLHRNPEQVRLDSTGIHMHEFDYMVDREQIVVLKKWFSEATLAEVQPHLV